MTTAASERTDDERHVDATASRAKAACRSSRSGTSSDQSVRIEVPSGGDRQPRDHAPRRAIASIEASACCQRDQSAERAIALTAVAITITAGLPDAIDHATLDRQRSAAAPSE